MVVYMESTLNLIAMKKGVDAAKKIADLGKLKQIEKSKYIIINN
jgi:hypothetical protein